VRVVIRHGYSSTLARAAGALRVRRHLEELSITRHTRPNQFIHFELGAARTYDVVQPFSFLFVACDEVLTGGRTPAAFAHRWRCFAYVSLRVAPSMWTV